MPKKPLDKKALQQAGTAPKQIKKRRRPTFAASGPHPVDVAVGAKLREARVHSGRTQEWVAGEVGVTFQQIQKYERGDNRISCSMLWSLAAALNREVEWFFAANTGKLSVEEADRQRTIYELTTNFAKIQNDSMKHHIVALTRALAAEKPDASEPHPARRRH